MVSEILVQIKLLEVEVKGETLKEMVMTIGLRTVTEVVEIVSFRSGQKKKYVRKSPSVK